MCVTPAEDIDLAVQLARHEGVTLASFGDMLRVPGKSPSIGNSRPAGGRERGVGQG